MSPRDARRTWLGALHRAAGDEERARLTYLRAVWLQQEAFGEDDARVGVTLVELASGPTFDEQTDAWPERAWGIHERSSAETVEGWDLLEALGSARWLDFGRNQPVLRRIVDQRATGSTPRGPVRQWPIEVLDQVLQALEMPSDQGTVTVLRRI